MKTERMNARKMHPHSPLTRILWKFYFSLIGIFLLVTPLFYYLTKHYYAEDMEDLVEAIRVGENIPKPDLEADIMMGLMIQYGVILLVLVMAMVLTFRLMQKEQRIYQAQKEFTENASHELQTPLAIIRSKLDLLIQREHDKQSTILIDELYGLTSRMERLNRNLLLLAKIENGQYDISQEVDTSAFVSDLLSGYQSLCPHMELKVDEAGGAKIKANAILLECLINNLVANAIRHSINQENEITISVTPGSLSVTNIGHNKSLAPSTLFLRFHKDDTSKGCGLGLAIVKAIADYHGWTTIYRYKAPAKHCFMIKFS